MENLFFMPSIDVSKCGGNVIVALKRLKRICDKNGLARTMRENERRTKNTALRRRAEAAAIKRSKKTIINKVKRVLETSYRYKNAALKTVISLFQ